MKFLILRQLQHSELGMFHAYRRSGREGSRQRAINFDGDVVDRVFPTASDTDRIALRLWYDTDEGPRLLEHSLKRQAKNWRLEGNCPVDSLYEFVEPDCLFVMQVDSSARPASGAWAVLPKDESTLRAILSDGAASALAGRRMIALELDEAPRIRQLLKEARRDLFGDTSPHEPNMTANSDTPFPSTPSSTPRRRLPPGPERLTSMLGAVGHNLASAVADIVDNAISADATEIHITFAPPDSGNGRWMAIRDNGHGMTPDQLDEAMRVGGAADYNSRSLGKYGFGLKGASWSQARDFMVVTRQSGEQKHHLGWDQDDMADWAVDESPLDEWEAQVADPGDHGTVVLWKNMKSPATVPAIKGVSPYVAEIKELTQHLGLVFHRFLDGKAKGRPPVSIWINDIPVESNGPASHPLTERHDVKTLTVEHAGGKADVFVQPVVLPSEDELRNYHGSGFQAAVEKIGYGRRTDTQGLFLYRNDRLISWGGWHSMWATNDEKTKLARVLLDFDPALDEAFSVNISKQTVQLPPYLLLRIKPLADTVRKASQKKFRKPAQTPSSPPPSTSPASLANAAPAASAVGGQPVTVASTAPAPTSPAQSTPPSPPLAVRKVTTAKFAWKMASDMKGQRNLQIGDLSPALGDLVTALGSNQAAVDALATFLEELDRFDVQQSMIDDTADA